VLAKLREDVLWFKTEIAVCEKAIREVESGRFYASSRNAVLSRIRATLDSHRESLADLEKQLATPARA
jgi:Zn-finger domain-containing protein